MDKEKGDFCFDSGSIYELCLDVGDGECTFKGLCLGFSLSVAAYFFIGWLDKGNLQVNLLVSGEKVIGVQFAVDSPEMEVPISLN